MSTDFLFKPFSYAVEKRAANVPNVASKRGRWKLDSANDRSGSAAPLEDHAKWNTLLKKYVHLDCTIGSIPKCNAVDYEGLANDPLFAEYLAQLASVDLSTLSKNEQLALWINAYNALCIQLIIQNDNPTIQSINNISTASQKVWDKEAGKVAGIKVSLNHIEHERLRGQWDVPSIHACIVCASASCPNLRPEAFVASRLADQMKSQVEDWLEHPTKGMALRREDHVLWLSRIFLWFASDFHNESAEFISMFSTKGSHFRAWLSQHVKDKDLADNVKNGRDGFRYFDYDWTLNRWKGAKA